MKLFRLRLTRFLPVGLALAVLLLPGCEKDEIATYTVPRPTMRFLGAIVPRPDATWFFRVSGSAEVVAENEKEFDEFLVSVRFSAVEEKKEPVTWTVPDGWKEESSQERTRYATFRARSGTELIVSLLGPEAAAVLPNVNRWRGQLKLPPVEEEQLKDITKTITVGDVKTATRVDFSGVSGSVAKPMARPPVAEKPRPAPPSAKPIEYDTPADWKPARAVMDQVAAFEAGDQGVNVTATAMRGPAGGLVANVNRWRGQVGLPEMTATEIAADGKNLKIGDKSALMVDLKGKGKRIVAAICETGGRTWFFKMTGPGDAVEKQVPAFDQFLRSVRFGGE